jgi:hypothetical protein
LAGSKLGSQLPLRPPFFATGVAEQKADVFSGRLRHIQEISQVS